MSCITKSSSCGPSFKSSKTSLSMLCSLLTPLPRPLPRVRRTGEGQPLAEMPAAAEAANAVATA
eukprot:3571179-Alexandrium_andersonii.AAC.1